jgi:hypothetical protein
MLIERHRVEHIGAIMKILRHLWIAGVLLFLSGVAVSGVRATVLPPTFNSASFGCDSVTFTYTANATPVNFRVVDGSSLVVSSSVLGQATGTHTLTITLTPPQPAGTILQIQQDIFGWTNFGPATACTGSAGAGEDIEPPPPPRWEHFGGEDAYAAFRFIDDGPDNPVLVFLRVSNDGEGSILFYLSKKMLERDYPCSGKVIDKSIFLNKIAFRALFLNNNASGVLFLINNASGVLFLIYNTSRALFLI